MKNPGFALIAVVTLALGIGANTAIFTVVNAALLRGLPYREPDRLVHLWEMTPQKEFPRREASYPDFLDWRRNQSFEAMAAYTGGGFTLTGRDAPELIQGARASADFFKALGVEPIAGRAFQPGDDSPGAANVVLLSYGLWQRRFGGAGAIVGQSLTLNGMAVIGGAAGLLLARWGIDALIAAIPEARLSAMPYLRGLRLDGSILAFTAGLSLLTGIVFGLAPAFQASGRELSESLKAGGKSAGVARQRLRNGLVITEIALALVLLVGAGLMTKSMLRLMAVDPGFRAENLFMITVILPAAKYTEDSKVAAFHQQLLARLEALPGAQGVATIGALPLVGGNTTRFIVEREPVPPPGQQTEANVRDVSAGYFRTMGIPLISGRHFNERDNASAPGVVIVNQTLARRVFPNGPAVGRRLIFTGDDRTPIEIAGVVGDEKVNGLDARTTPVVYYPFLQGPSRFTNLIVRAPNQMGPTGAAGLANAIRQEGLALEPELTFFGGLTMERLMENLPATFARRYPAFLIGIFALIALTLATVGIYGVISYSVSQRTREIGVRMVLGAHRRDVLKLALKQGMTLAAAGVAIGLAAAFGLTRLMSGLLFGVGATDPGTFAAIAALLLLVALVACYIPARRAAKVDPMIALRCE